MVQDWIGIQHGNLGPQRIRGTLRGKEKEKNSTIRQFQDCDTLDNTIHSDLLDFISFGFVSSLWNIEDLVDHDWVWVWCSHSSSLDDTCVGAEYNIIHFDDILSSNVQVMRINFVVMCRVQPFRGIG